MISAPTIRQGIIWTLRALFWAVGIIIMLISNGQLSFDSDHKVAHFFFQILHFISHIIAGGSLFNFWLILSPILTRMSLERSESRWPKYAFLSHINSMHYLLLLRTSFHQFQSWQWSTFRHSIWSSSEGIHRINHSWTCLRSCFFIIWREFASKIFQINPQFIASLRAYEGMRSGSRVIGLKFLWLRSSISAPSLELLSFRFATKYSFDLCSSPSFNYSYLTFWSLLHPWILLHNLASLMLIIILIPLDCPSVVYLKSQQMLLTLLK